MRFDYKNRVLAKHKAARKDRKQQRIQDVKLKDEMAKDDQMDDEDDNKVFKNRADLTKAQRK